MSELGQKERATQNRVVKLFQDHLYFTYLGNWYDRENNSNIEKALLYDWLSRQDVSETLINRSFRALEQACALGDGKHLYEANKEVYSLLRYGVKVKEGAGEQNQTVWLIDWENPHNNDFAIAEEVSIKGENNLLWLNLSNVSFGGITPHHTVTVEKGSIFANGAFHHRDPLATIIVIQGQYRLFKLVIQ